MERRERQPRLRSVERVLAVGHKIVDHILHAPVHSSDHYRPSAQRDVGKSAVRALEVQNVIAGLRVERTDCAQLAQTANRWDSLGDYLRDEV